MASEAPAHRPGPAAAASRPALRLAVLGRVSPAPKGAKGHLGEGVHDASPSMSASLRAASACRRPWR